MDGDTAKGHTKSKMHEAKQWKRGRGQRHKRDPFTVKGKRKCNDRETVMSQ